MRLTPSEVDRLTIHLAAELARKRRGSGLRLNHPEALALICDAMHEAARAGAGYDDVAQAGTTVLTADDVMDGVPELVANLRIECLFADGNRLVTLPAPIVGATKASRSPGEFLLSDAPIEINSNRRRVTLEVANTSRRPVFIGSHFPFAEVNARLTFNREEASGMHLDVPAGDAVGWQPGEKKVVTLVAHGGDSSTALPNTRTDRQRKVGERPSHRTAGSLTK